MEGLIKLLLQLIIKATKLLATDLRLLPEWKDTMQTLIARYATASYMLGQGKPQLTAGDKQKITKMVNVQLDYLDKFELEIGQAEEFNPAWESRAEQYAGAIVAPYWQGKTKMLPLPSMPGELDTQCGVRCRCKWRIEQLDGEGNYDCYWELDKNKATSHCQTCQVRAEEWNPLKIREGKLERNG